MTDNPINPSIVALLTLSLETITRQVVDGEGYEDREALLGLHDAALELHEALEWRFGAVSTPQEEKEPA